MQLQYVLVSGLLATIGTGHPLSGTPQVVKRSLSNALLGKRAEITGEHCGSDANGDVDYDKTWVQSAFDDMQRYVNVGADQRPSAGTRTYPLRNEARDPEVATALDTIDGCETGQDGKTYWEFPLTSDGWNGGPERSQGPDRVIGIGTYSGGQGGTWALTYCLSVTHRGQANNENVPCTDID
ncbi:hypothetical protein TruAng_002269 [Truncatella angustata]|nr:hypothetical protein TruAng_002269 [Truncatella angustata]